MRLKYKRPTASDLSDAALSGLIVICSIVGWATVGGLIATVHWPG